MIRKIWILFLVSLFPFPMISLAEYTFELIPRISVSQVYADNISRENRKLLIQQQISEAAQIRTRDTALPVRAEGETEQSLDQLRVQLGSLEQIPEQ